MGVVAPIGPGSYGLRPSVFVPLATIAGLTGTQQINIIRVAAPQPWDQRLGRTF